MENKKENQPEENELSLLTKEEQAELATLEAAIQPKIGCRKCYGKGHVGQEVEQCGDRWVPTGRYVSCTCIKKTLKAYVDRRNSLTIKAKRRKDEPTLHD